MIVQVISLVGAVMILAAFALQQQGRWRATDPVYLWANFIGSAVLTAVAWIGSQWGFVLLEGAWSGFSAYGLWKIRQSA